MDSSLSSFLSKFFQAKILTRSVKGYNNCRCFMATLSWKSPGDTRKVTSFQDLSRWQDLWQGWSCKKIGWNTHPFKLKFKKMLREQGPNSYLLLFLWLNSRKKLTGQLGAPPPRGGWSLQDLDPVIPSYSKQFLLDQKKHHQFQPFQPFKGCIFWGTTHYNPFWYDPHGAWCHPLNPPPGWYPRHKEATPWIWKDDHRFWGA